MKMRPATSSLSSTPRAFGEPAYWIALALLIANDHGLKGAGFLPAWLTGKLSDFTGLLVAPPLLAMLLYALARALGAGRERLISISAPLLVGLAFAAIKLDAGCARLAENMFLAIGVAGSTIQVDPTDLMALVVLPWASRLCLRSQLPQQAPGRPAALRLGQSIGQRVGIAIASFACIATTGDDEEGGGRSDVPELLNASEETLIVHIASTDGAGGCRVYRDDRIGVLTPDAFAARREIVLEPRASALLVSSGVDPACGAAYIALQDGSEARVYWRDLAKIEEFLPDEDERRTARRVVLRGETNRFRFEIGDDLNRLELSDEPVGSTCTESLPDYSLEATALALTPGFYEVGEKTRDIDDCLMVEWFEQSGDTEPDVQRLCVPDWAFPFEEGETLSVSETQLESGERRLRITRYDETTFDQQLTIWNDASTLADSHIAKLVAGDCIGTLHECGAYVRPIEIELHGDEGVIVPGDEVDLTDGSDDIRLIVGAGRDVAWSAAACTGAEARVGSRVNLLELRTN